MAKKLKDPLSKNTIRNIKDQTQSETSVEFASAFDMKSRV